jgi:hypothetical protein
VRALRSRLLGWEWTQRAAAAERSLVSAAQELSERTRRLEDQRARMEEAVARRAAELQNWQESLESWMNHVQTWQESLLSWMNYFQKSVTDGLGEIASRIGREEDRGNVEANLVEDAIIRLARADAEALEDALLREDDWRDELETKLRRFLDT